MGKEVDEKESVSNIIEYIMCYTYTYIYLVEMKMIFKLYLNHPLFSILERPKTYYKYVYLLPIQTTNQRPPRQPANHPANHRFHIHIYPRHVVLIKHFLFYNTFSYM